MPSFDYTLTTDENGYFQHTARYDPPGPLSLNVKLSATLREPVDTTAQGRLDIDPADGGRGNQARDFVVAAGETTMLGSWRLNKRENIIVLSGRTIPSHPSTALHVTVAAKL